jgi:hypothetical protein
MVKDGFTEKSAGGVMEECIGALDGWLCQIQTPCISDTPNQMAYQTPCISDTPNQMAYFSGHFKCYGMNVQAQCNSEC